MIKVAIIGFGYSGKRFYEILKVRQKKQNDIKIVGICDNNPNALTGLNDIFTCTKVEKLFMISKDIDIIIIAVNEKYRFEIFKEVLKYKNKFKIIISEKLLTENVEQAEKVLEMYQNFGVFVHYQCQELCKKQSIQNLLLLFCLFPFYIIQLYLY